MLGKLPRAGNESTGDEFVQNLLHWLASRQTSYLLEDDDLTMVTEDASESVAGIPSTSFQVQGAYPVSAVNSSNPAEISAEAPALNLECAGFNGRCNKVADTCYAFWVGGSLGVSAGEEEVASLDILH